MKAAYRNLKIAMAGAGTAADGFICHHPYMSMSLALAGMPLVLVAAVSLVTALVALPMGMMFGWL